jgi:hypothetical protein
MVISHKPDLLMLSTRELLARRHRLASYLDDLEHVLAGSLVEQMRRCGKLSCRCASGDPHGPYAYFTPRRSRRGMRYVPATLVGSVRACIRHAEHVDGVLAEISAINVELLARRALH